MIPGVRGKFCLGARNEAGQRLTEFCQENRLIVFFVAEDGEGALYSQQQKRPGNDCSSNHDLITKFRLTLKKVGKTTRPFRYDLNQIPYAYTVEVMNRFKGLGSDRVPEELGQKFITLHRRQ